MADETGAVDALVCEKSGESVSDSAAALLSLGELTWRVSCFEPTKSGLSTGKQGQGLHIVTFSQALSSTVAPACDPNGI
jgi:hypothetical protein